MHNDLHIKPFLPSIFGPITMVPRNSTNGNGLGIVGDITPKSGKKCASYGNMGAST